jgi:phosphomannomutase
MRRRGCADAGGRAGPGLGGWRSAAYNAPVTATPIRFGTDGWRAVVADDFTYGNVRAVAQAVAWYLATDERPVVVGHDTRYCAELFAQEVARVLAANGRSVLLLDGPAPTQVSSWTVVSRGAAGGVVVTASHNPPEFNGLKYKPDYGGSASPEVVAELERLSARAQEEGVSAMPFHQALEEGRVTMIDPLPEYTAQVARMVDLPRLRGAGLHVLHEAMYGAGAGWISRLLAGGTTRVDELHAERNPGFGGLHPEPIAHYMPEAMARMRDASYDLGIANDGDADRVGIIDERGMFVNQLQVMGLLCLYLLERRGQRGALVRSLTTTGMVDRLGEIFGVPVHELQVGFKYIGPRMTETDALIGGEESGGFGFRGHLPERDGILAGLMVAAMIVDYEMPLSAILAHLEELVGPHAYARHDIALEREGYADRQREMYLRLGENPPRELAGEEVVRTRSDDGFKFYLADGSWVLVRFSGTEPLIRVYSEAPTDARVQSLLAALEEFLGVRRTAGASQ